MPWHYDESGPIRMPGPVSVRPYVWWGGAVLLLALGMSWILASLGTFLRDLSQVIGIATTALYQIRAIDRAGLIADQNFADTRAGIFHLAPAQRIAVNYDRLHQPILIFTP